MKRILQVLAFVALAFATNQAYAQVGIGTETAHRSSVLELKAEGRGLLIPRVELTATNNKGPIHETPEHSLLVYNTATANDVEPGFYYWVKDATLNVVDFPNGGYWEAFMTNKNLDNKAGDGIFIDEDGKINIDTRADGNAANHTTAGNQFLVTVNDGTSTTTQWVDRTAFLTVFLDGQNGVTKNVAGDGTIYFELGGTLNRETIITATDTEFFKVETAGKSFLVNGLGEVKVDSEGMILDGNNDPTTDKLADDFKVMIVGAGGLVQQVSIEDLLTNTVAVENGLRYDETSETIKLGGVLVDPTTTIDINGKDFVLDAKTVGGNVVIDASENGAIEINTNETTPNLEITGLKEFERDAVRETLVLDADNKVRTVTTQEVALLTALDLTDASSGYKDYIKVIYIEVPVTDLSSAKTITLPAASNDNIGQVIEVKITGENDAQNDLEIKVGGTTLGYGAVANQKWTIRSFGTVWKVVSNF